LQPGACGDYNKDLSPKAEDDTYDLRFT